MGDTVLESFRVNQIEVIQNDETVFLGKRINKVQIKLDNNGKTVKIFTK